MSNEELIAEVGGYVDALTGGEDANWLALVDLARRLGLALEAQSAPLVADSREALARAITDHRVTGPSEGEPSDEMVEHFGGALADHLLASGVVSLAADRDRAIAERAWAEGHDAALWNAQWPQDRKSNPYRESEGK